MRDRYDRAAFMRALYTGKSASVFINPADDETYVGDTETMPQSASECVRFTPASAPAAPVSRLR